MKNIDCEKCNGTGKIAVEDEKFMYVWLGIQIKTRREKIGITQEELADSVGLTRTSITNIERGKQWSGLVNLKKIAAKLQCNLSDLLPPDEE